MSLVKYNNGNNSIWDMVWHPSLYGLDWFKDFETPLTTKTNSILFNETENDITYAVQIPGADKEQANVTVQDNNLNITANFKVFDTEKSYSYSLKIPNRFDLSKIKCKINNGMMFITIDKKEKLKEQKILIE